MLQTNVCILQSNFQTKKIMMIAAASETVKIFRTMAGFARRPEKKSFRFLHSTVYLLYIYTECNYSSDIQEFRIKLHHSVNLESNIY